MISVWSKRIAQPSHNRTRYRCEDREYRSIAGCRGMKVAGKESSMSRGAGIDTTVLAPGSGTEVAIA